MDICRENAAGTIAHVTGISEQRLPDPAEFKKTALIFVDTRPDLFQADFLEWLDQNFHVWREFERQADRAWNVGYKHYSARTIIEVVRFETDMRERGGDYKINNNFIPDLARLYLQFHPERGEFFEFRVQKNAPRAA